MPKYVTDSIKVFDDSDDLETILMKKILMKKFPIQKIMMKKSLMKKIKYKMQK